MTRPHTIFNTSSVCFSCLLSIQQCGDTKWNSWIRRMALSTWIRKPEILRLSITSFLVDLVPADEGRTKKHFLKKRKGSIHLKPRSAMTWHPGWNKSTNLLWEVITSSVVLPPYPVETKLMSPSGVTETQYFNVLHPLYSEWALVSLDH